MLESAHDTAEMQILDAAERLFAQGGYEATSMRDVAQAAGVNVATLYYHCGSKREIFALIYARVVERIAAFVAETFATGGAFEDVAARVVDRVVAFFARHPSVARLLERAHLGELPSESMRVGSYDALLDTAAAELRRQAELGNIRPVEPRPFIAAAAGVFFHLVIDAADKGPPDAATLASLQAHARMFILGALGIDGQRTQRTQEREQTP